MDYETLINFVQSKMRMSHIYQPVMLMTLLNKDGHCHEREIAKSLLGHDQSQIEYYTEITNNMVGRILRNHEIVTRDRQTKPTIWLGIMN
jgi:ATP adenylyltransferase